MASPICLYNKVALTISLVTSLNWRHVGFTSVILNDYCGGGAKERWGSRGLPPDKFLRTTASRTSESALLKHRVKVTIIIDVCAQKEN